MLQTLQSPACCSHRVTNSHQPLSGPGVTGWDMIRENQSDERRWLANQKNLIKLDTFKYSVNLLFK